VTLRTCAALPSVKQGGGGKNHYAVSRGPPEEEGEGTCVTKGEWGTLKTGQKKKVSHLRVGKKSAPH